MPSRVQLRVLLTAILTALTTLVFSQNAAADFGISDAEMSNARPGALLRLWPLEGGVKQGVRGYRILYRSTGMNGEPIAVTGALIIPPGPVPAGGRPVVAWAHPTTGVVTRCSPTLLPDLSGTIQGLDEMLDRGYIIAATDYQGLGTKDPHPYLIGIAAAHNILDSVRAARELKDAHASNHFAVWGHSQGGHAALFTGELTASYAPELKLVGVAAAAPATALTALFEADRDTVTGRSLTAMAILSWTRTFKLTVDDVVDRRAFGPFEELANDCIESIKDFLKEEKDEKRLEDIFLKADPVKLPAWRMIMDQNTPGRAPAGAPVFLAQGLADKLVRPSLTREFARRLCSAGTRVRYVALEGVQHIYAARDSAFDAVSWIAARFRGEPAPSDCER